MNFKRRFLPQFSTKSRLLPLRGRGIERGRGRTQDKQARKVSRQSIRLILAWMLKNVKNMPFYRAKIRNRPIKTIDGYDETVHHGPFRKCRSRPIAMDGPDAIVRETL